MLTGVFKDRRDAMVLIAGALVDAQNICMVVYVCFFCFAILIKIWIFGIFN